MIEECLTLWAPLNAHTNSPDWSLYISLQSKLREFDKIWKHSPGFDDHFIDSQNLFSQSSIEIVGRE